MLKKITAVIVALAAVLGFYIGFQPDEFSFFEGEGVSAKSPILSLEFEDDTAQAASISQTGISQGKYEAKLKLFGLLPIKTAQINVIKQQEMIPLGLPFGVKLYTRGVIVVGSSDVVCGGQKINPAHDAGIREGDVILSYNGVQIRSNEELSEQVQKSGGQKQEVKVQRNNLEFTASVTPVRDDGDGSYRIGIWVRDSTAGIGTLTFYNKTEKTLAGLGHSISDTDTGLMMPVSSGQVIKAVITGTQVGTVGSPGELLGEFKDNIVYGSVTENNTTGLFAKCTTEQFDDMPSYEIALKQEIETGPAQILATVDGESPQAYDIEIEKINNNLENTRNMVIRITDQRLIDKTGGIVQGMSGSPIIQNGKLIGAVTHVLVSNPQKGYAIFIEKMLLGE